MSSKLKLWVESHLIRGRNPPPFLAAAARNQSGHHNSIGKESPTDSIAHPAASLVTLIPVCSSNMHNWAFRIRRAENLRCLDTIGLARVLRAKAE